MPLALAPPTGSTLLLLVSVLAGVAFFFFDLFELPRPVARLVRESLQSDAPAPKPISAPKPRTPPAAPPTRGPPWEPQPYSDVPPEQVPRKHNFTIYQYAHRYGDLPPLPPRRRPRQDLWDPWWDEWDNGDELWHAWDGWDNSIAICACMFQENMTDVREWLLYHQWLGIDHVYLTENSSPPPEDMVAQLQDFIDSGFVTFEAVGKPDYQPFFYHACMLHHRHKHNWMAFIDLDEFIVLRKQGTTLKEYLDDFKDEVALAMHWVMVGPSGQVARPRAGGALRTYTECQHEPSDYVKSIANSWYLSNVAGNPHVFEYRGDRQTVNEKREELGWKEDPPPACNDGTVRDPARDPNCRPVPNIAIDKGGSADDIALFHYLTKSKEDFERKMRRGGGGGTHRQWRHFEKVSARSEPGGICDDAAAAAEQCCDPRQYVLAPHPAPNPAPKRVPRRKKKRGGRGA